MKKPARLLCTRLTVITALVVTAQAWTAETQAAEARVADAIYPLITYKCDPDADVIVLTNSLLKKDEGPGFNYSDEDGTYSPWNMVEISRSNERTRIVRTRKIVKKCMLSSGEYTVTLEPQVFSRNLSGTCGASISSAFTITYDGIDIRERTPFEDFCRGNSPIITRVTVFGKTGEVKIKRIARHKFH
ncbi:MAG TPA: hypothetical protein ENI98_07490 [Gammaproteobacteria bacterium]|nr:hypothetical protein [Gammaproteobacteria bacterium]